MEAGQIEVDDSVGVTAGTTYTPPAAPAQAEYFDSPKFDPSQASSAKTKKVKITNQESQENDIPPSVSKCYVFKSQLQEYCQKAGLTTPVYETSKEGPSHEPSFKSNVMVNNVRYDSLPGFFNRKASEQSAAEVALVELAKINDMKFGITQPVNETGLCKNLLQEYSQKMNYAIPLYECRKEEKEGRMPMHSCVVEVGGMKYIGASANTKKEAEIKAARTALLAIQTAVPVSEDQTGNSIYTVIPHKKKLSDLAIGSKDTDASLKPKKKLTKKKKFIKKKRHAKRDDSTVGVAHLEVNTDGQVGVVGLTVTDAARSEPNAAADFRVDMVGQGGMEVYAVDTVESHVKTNAVDIVESHVADAARSESNAAADFRVDMVGQGGMEVYAVHTVESHVKTNAVDIVESHVADAARSESNAAADFRVDMVGQGGMEVYAVHTVESHVKPNAVDIVESHVADAARSESNAAADFRVDMVGQGGMEVYAVHTVESHVKPNAVYIVESHVADAARSESNAAADFRVDMVGQGGMEVYAVDTVESHVKTNAVDTVDSHVKTNAGSNIYEDGQRNESSVTSIVSSHEDVGKSGTNACSTYDGHVENTGVPFDESHKDWVATVMDVN